MSSLTVRKEANTYFLEGILDENADLSPLKGLEGDLKVNFKGVSRVNSCGVREWVNLIQSLKGVKLVYLECPVVVVKQLNSVPDFHGGARVESFYAPYFCDDTEEETVQLIRPEQVVGGKAPEMKTEKGEDLIFDAVASQYFSFLGRNGTP